MRDESASDLKKHFPLQFNCRFFAPLQIGHRHLVSTGIQNSKCLAVVQHVIKRLNSNLNPRAHFKDDRTSRRGFVTRCLWTWICSCLSVARLWQLPSSSFSSFSSPPVQSRKDPALAWKGTTDKGEAELQIMSRYRRCALLAMRGEGRRSR